MYRSSWISSNFLKNIKQCYIALLLKMFQLHLILSNKSSPWDPQSCVGCSLCLPPLPHPPFPQDASWRHPSSPSKPNPLLTQSSHLSPFQKLGCSSPNSHLSRLHSHVTCFDQSSQPAKHPHSQSVRPPILFISITEMIIISNCLVLLFVHTFIVCIGCCFTSSVKIGTLPVSPTLVSLSYNMPHVCGRCSIVLELGGGYIMLFLGFQHPAKWLRRLCLNISGGKESTTPWGIHSAV